MPAKRTRSSPFKEQAITTRIDIDPQELSVNIRFGGGHIVPPGTRRAMDRIRDEIKKKAEELAFSIGPTDYLSLEITFAFGSWRSDLDNPLKRTLDASSEALKFNDNRVVEIHMYRKTVGAGNQYMAVTFRTIAEEDVPSPIGAKRPSALPIWVG